MKTKTVPAHGHPKSAAIDGYVGGLGVAAGAVALHQVVSAPVEVDRWGAVLALAAVLALLKFLPAVRVRRMQLMHSHNVVEAGVLLTAAVLSDGEAILSLTIAATAIALLWSGCWHKSLFNASEMVLAGAIAVLIAGEGPFSTGRSLLSLLLAGMAYALVSNGLAWVAMAVSQGMTRRDVRDGLATAAVTSVLALPLGMLAASVSATPLLLVLLISPVAAVIITGSGRDRSRVASHRTQVLLDASVAAGSASAIDELRELLLVQASRITGGRASYGSTSEEGAIAVSLDPALSPHRWLNVEPPTQRIFDDLDPIPVLHTLSALIAAASENLALRAQLEQQATIDELTGLGNRHLFASRLDAAAARAERGRGFGILFIDLNGFKAVNDTHGHEAGDLLLTATADRLRGAVRQNDEVFRLGGDEFSIIADGVAEEDALLGLEQNLASVLREPYDDAHGLEVSASIGGSLWRPGLTSPWEIVRDADLRMYGAKREYKKRRRP